MINELVSLAESIEKAGITTSSIHKDYLPIPAVSKKKPCYQLFLNSEGQVVDIDLITEENRASKLRKYGNKQWTFPAFNMAPLFIVDEETYKKAVSDYSKLPTFIDSAMSFWGEKEQKKFNRCFASAQASVWPLLKDEPDSVMKVLLSRMKKCEESETTEQESVRYDQKFRNSLQDCLLRLCVSCSEKETKDALMQLLLQKPPKGKKPEDTPPPSMSVFLDVADWELLGYPVAHSKTTNYFNSILLKKIGLDDSDSEYKDTDAFHTAFVNPDEPMPEVKVGGIPIILRSMNEAIPCQNRYRKISDRSYPISRENRARIKSALEWISDPSRDGQTWKKYLKDEVMLAYPNKITSQPLSIPGLFTSSVTSETQEALFTAASHKFLTDLSQLSDNTRPDTVHLIILKKMDKARTKVLMSQTSTPEHIKWCIAEWKCGFTNLPLLRTNESPIPFPFEVAETMNNVWKYDGTKAQGKAKVEILKKYQGAALFLDTVSKVELQRFLHTLLNNTEGLVLNASNGSTLQHEECTRALMLTGYLLYKLNHRKEDYMENMAFMLGQMLHLSDDIHLKYCQKVRGSVPPQLVGASFFTMANEKTSQVLGLLGTRMLPYLNWAKQYSNSGAEDSKLVAWMCKQYGELALKLSKTLQPVSHLNDYQKGELFIGYISKITSSVVEQANTPVSTED